MGKEGLVGQLLLVLLPDPVMDFVEPHDMLQKYYLRGHLVFCVGEFTIADKGYYSCAKGMYIFF